MANYRESIVDIELTSGTVARSFLTHTLGGSDYNADRFGVNAYRNSSPETLTGTVSGYFVRADGYTVPIASGVVSGNKAYITLTEACYEVEGKFTLSIKLTGNGMNGTVRIVDGVVARTSTNAAASTTLVPNVESLISAIDDATASIPADYSDLWTTLAPAFSSEESYAVGQYVTYNQNLYRFKTAHSGSWSNSDVVNVNVGDELTIYVEKGNKSIEDAICCIGSGDSNDMTVRLTGQIVPYRYQGGTKITTQTSIRYKLPENVKTVNISMYGLQNMDSYAFLDESDNVLFYKTESTNASVSYEGLLAWEAKYLVCSNNNTYINTINVDAVIAGVGRYIDEAKGPSGEKWTLLKGEPKGIYYSDFTQGEANYSVEFDIEGYDYVQITSYNISGVNKYTMFDGNGDIIGFFHNSVIADWQTTTTVKVAVPANAETMLVSTYRASRPNVTVYGITMPSSWEWVNCGGEFVDYLFQGYTEVERENGSKEFAASGHDILRLVNGTPTNGNNAFTAFDENGTVIGYESLHDYEIPAEGEAYFICPPGTVKVAVAAKRAGAGWDTSATIQVQKRKTSLRLSVMGDSISTYDGFQPDDENDYNPYYGDGAHDVPQASYIWWGIVAREMGWKVSTVNAWGGSQVSDTGGDYTVSAMCMDRAENLDEHGTPDVIIIYGGMNDFTHGVPLGTWAGAADLPTTGEQFRKAYALMLNKIHSNYPMAKVYCCTVANCERDLVPGSLEKLHDQYLHQFNAAIREIAPLMNCTVIECESCGINQYNMEDYMTDWNEETGKATHPNAAGHRLIAQRVLKSLI